VKVLLIAGYVISYWHMRSNNKVGSVIVLLGFLSHLIIIIIIIIAVVMTMVMTTVTRRLWR